MAIVQILSQRGRPSPLLPYLKNTLPQRFTLFENTFDPCDILLFEGTSPAFLARHFTRGSDSVSVCHLTETGARSGIAGALDRRLCRSCDYLLVEGEKMKELALLLGAAPKKVYFNIVISPTPFNRRLLKTR